MKNYLSFGGGVNSVAKKPTKKEGRELYREFGKEMIPAIRNCANFWNAAMKKQQMDNATSNDADREMVGDDADFFDGDIGFK